MFVMILAVKCGQTYIHAMGRYKIKQRNPVFGKEFHGNMLIVVFFALPAITLVMTKKADTLTLCYTRVQRGLSLQH